MARSTPILMKYPKVLEKKSNVLMNDIMYHTFVCEQKKMEINKTFVAYDDITTIGKGMKDKQRHALNVRYFYRFHLTKSMVDPSGYYHTYANETNLWEIQIENLQYDYVYELAIILCPKIKVIHIRKLCDEVDIQSSDLQGIKARRYIQADGNVSEVLLRKDTADKIEYALLDTLKV